MSYKDNTRLVTLGDQIIDPETQAGQSLLAEAHDIHGKPKCLCRTNAPDLYIARVGDRYIVKRFPGTGHLHAPDCASFDPPEELSGLAHLRKALRVDESGDCVHLKLAFPLTQAGRRAAPPPSKAGPKADVVDTPGKLSLGALLHYLWHEAALTTWVPAMQGKRNWYIVRHELLEVASHMEAKGFRLGERLFIPESFNVRYKDEIAERRGRFLNRLVPVPGRPKSLAVVVAPLKSHAPSAYGGKLTLLHMADMPLYVSAEMYDRLCDTFADRLVLADQIEGGRAILAGLMGYSESGYPILQEAALMVVTPEFLPVETLRDAQVIAGLVQHKRRFVRQLRFNLKLDAPIATAVLTDTADPQALFVTPPEDVTDSTGKMALVAEEGVYESWLWDHAGPIPAFPPRRTRTEAIV